MSRILLVEDDPAQLEMRRLILEAAGHEVEGAASYEEALERAPGRDIVVLDLIPRSADLVATLAPETRVIVLSGHPPSDNAVRADRVFHKPCPSRLLLAAIAQLGMLLLFVLPLAARDFSLDAAGETVAELDMRAPGTDWADTDHPAVLATLSLDGKPLQQVMLYAGAERFTYRVFLGRLDAGRHALTVDTPGAELLAVRTRLDASEVLSHAPILYARPNTIGKFTDIPLLTYCERLQEDGLPMLQYTVIYSNEDAGTSTRALMARWGRTTDIEWVYKAFLNPDGSTHHATIQAAAHKEIEFKGQLDGLHPFLLTATDNNNVAYDRSSPVRYQIPPVLLDLSAHSREELMDERPFAYSIMAKELRREGKLRPYGTVEGQNVSDPKNYLYFEANLVNHDSAADFLVRLKDGGRWYSGDAGRTDYAITRDGWVRTTIELPPGTRPDQIAEVGIECRTVPNKVAGACEILAVSKCFFLDDTYKPGANLWTLRAKQQIPAGQIWTSPLR